MQIQDLYVRLVDPAGRHAPVISHHRVWDRDRFLEAQREAYERKAKDDDKRLVEITTEAAYRADRGYKEQSV